MAHDLTAKAILQVSETILDFAVELLDEKRIDCRYNYLASFIVENDSNHFANAMIMANCQIYASQILVQFAFSKSSISPS